MLQWVTDQSGGRALKHVLVKPSVYLDQWALRRISSNKSLAKRLIETIRDREGTLALSTLNFYEFARVGDGENARAAESLIDAIQPRLFFINISPAVVIDLERSGARSAPSDRETLVTMTRRPRYFVLSAHLIWQCGPCQIT